MAVTDSGKLAAQLRILLQLTHSEAQVAEIRVAQARTDAVRRELAQNATNSEKRSVAIARELRRLGGVPDVLTPALGRVVALAKAGAEQTQPLPEAIFGDLALEHQLLDRARYVKVLAKELDDKSVVALAARLEKAHSATVEWLTTVIAEEALGGPAALRATPVQAVAGGAYRIALLPGRWTLNRVNEAADRVSRSTEEARSKIGELRGKVVEIGGQTFEVLSNTFSTAVRQGEDTARTAARQGEAKVREVQGNDAGDKVHEARRSAGVLQADELPIKGYANLPATEAADAVKKLQKAEDIRAIVRFEETNKDRSTVVSAAQAQLARIAKDAVSSN